MSVDTKVKFLYATLDDNNLDEFKNLINKEDDKVLKLLYQMLTFESNTLDQEDIDLNKTGAIILGNELDTRGIKRPEIIK